MVFGASLSDLCPPLLLKIHLNWWLYRIIKFWLLLTHRCHLSPIIIISISLYHIYFLCMLQVECLQAEADFSREQLANMKLKSQDTDSSDKENGVLPPQRSSKGNNWRGEWTLWARTTYSTFRMIKRGEWRPWGSTTHFIIRFAKLSSGYMQNILIDTSLESEKERKWV